jgi:hypothetical protein
MWRSERSGRHLTRRSNNSAKATPTPPRLKLGDAPKRHQPRRLNSERSCGRTRRSPQLTFFARGFANPFSPTIMSSPSSRNRKSGRPRMSDVTGVLLQLPANSASMTRPSPLRFAEWIDGESARRAIIARPSMSPRGDVRGVPPLAESGEEEGFATLRQPVRHEVVTHVFGTFRCRCVRTVQMNLLVPRKGFEPPTHALRMRCSTS